MEDNTQQTGEPQTNNQAAQYRIALWTPLPPLKTGIADYVAELLPHLAEYFDLEIFVDDNYDVGEEYTARYKVFSYSNYAERVQERAFDLNIYEMGNNVYHLYIYNQALSVPGLVVLHDLSLSMVLYHYYVGMRGDLAAFKAEFEYSEGERTVRQFDEYYNTGKEKELMELFGGQPMLRRLVERNYAILTHLEYATQQVRERYSAKHVYTMYLGSPDPYEELGTINKESARESLGFSKEQFIIGIFGHLQATKQNDVAIRALARLARKYPDALMAFVGPVNPSGGYDGYINDLVEKLGVKENVKMTGFVSKEALLQYLASSDVIVNLRYPSFGAMSATLSRAIAAGKPVIITDLPEWKFFSEDYCWRVPPADRDGTQLETYLRTLVEDRSLAEERGKKARDFYLREGTTEHAAQSMQNVVDDVITHVPKEIVRGEPLISSEHALGELARTAFTNWDNLRAGGNKRYVFERLRRVPLFGPLIFATYRAFGSLLNMRAFRRAEWSFNNTLSESIFKLETQLLKTKNELAEVRNLYGAISQTSKEMNEAIQKDLTGVRQLQAQVSQQVSQVRKGLVEIQEFPALRVLENPLENANKARWQIQETLLKNILSEGQVSGTKEDAFYISFENVFRGSMEVVRGRQERVFSALEPFLMDAEKPVLDIGCGRGEFLSLMKERKIKAIGLETNALLASHLKQEGFEVYSEDAVEYLKSLKDGSLTGITAFHVIEHFDNSYLMDFLALAYKKLAKGGFVYFETPNPYCFESLSNFYTDPTHVRPIQPFQLSFLLEYNQFTEIKLLFQEPVPSRGSFSEERWIRLYQDYGGLAKK